MLTNDAVYKLGLTEVEMIQSSDLLLMRPGRDNNNATLGLSNDPNDSTRKMASVTAGTAGQGYQLQYWFEYPGGGEGSDGTIDRQPSDVYVSFHFEYAETITTGTTNWIQILRLKDTSGDEILLRQRGGTLFFQWLNNGAGDILTATHRHDADTAADTRYELRLHYDSTNDAITVSVLNVDAGTLLIDEEAVDTIDGTREGGTGLGKLRSITLGALTSGLANTLYFSKFIVSPTAPAAMDSTTPWWVDNGTALPPIVGQQNTEATDQGIDVKVVYPFEPGLMGSTGTWKFEYRQGTSGTWRSAGIVTANSRNMMFGELNNLAGGTAYQVRLSNTAGTIRSGIASFETETHSTSSGSVLKYGFCSCVSGRTLPHTVFKQASDRGVLRMHVLEDMQYVNTIMNYGEGSEWATVYSDRDGARDEWTRLVRMQMLNPLWRYGPFTVGLGDHLFVNDFAGGLSKYASGADLNMVNDIKALVVDVLSGFRFWDGEVSTGQYWSTWKTAKVGHLWLNSRMDCTTAETRTPSNPGEPWDGDVSAMALADISGMTDKAIMGSTQTGELRDFVRTLNKPILMCWTPALVSTGGMREYQDVGVVAGEIWELIEDAVDNPNVKIVIFCVGDLHNVIITEGKAMLTDASASRLGVDRNMLGGSTQIAEWLVGAGLRTPHRLRWQWGNSTDNDGGLRGGTYDGASNPRWTFARDTGSLYAGPDASWDLDDSDGTFGDANVGDLGGRMSAYGVVEIDEANLTVTMSAYDGETDTLDFSKTYTVPDPDLRGGFIARAASGVARAGPSVSEALAETRRVQSRIIDADGRID